MLATIRGRLAKEATSTWRGMLHWKELTPELTDCRRGRPPAANPVVDKSDAIQTGTPGGSSVERKVGLKFGLAQNQDVDVDA